MPEIAKMLGVELEEQFIVHLSNGKENVVLKHNGFYSVNQYGDIIRDNSILLSKLLQGYYNYKIEKLPWEPKRGERYYFPSITDKCVVSNFWDGATMELALKAFGYIYRTKEEAEAHFAEDYEKLTGKKLE